MRKLMALFIAPMLGTGAIQSATADSVNVIENPEEFILVEQMIEGVVSLSRGVEIEASALKPSVGESRERYSIKGEVVKGSSDADLEKVAVCLYDINALDQSTSLDDLCGYGSEASLETIKGAIGLNRSQSALQASFDLPLTGAELVNDQGQNNLHQIYTTSEGSQLQDATDFGEVGSGIDYVDFAIAVSLSHASTKANSWQLRVVAIYEDATRVELVDSERSYEVLGFSSISTGRGESVNYGELIPGNSKTVSGISTGSYFSNHPADVFLEATNFAPTAGGDDVVYTTSAPGAANAFALECLVPELSPVFISNPGSSVLISDAIASNTQANIEDPKTLPDHNCTLHAGEGVDFGVFTNTVTVGIGETP